MNETEDILVNDHGSSSNGMVVYINGERRKYDTSGMGLGQDRKTWELQFSSSKFTDSDSFIFNLPLDISAGDVVPFRAPKTPNINGRTFYEALGNIDDSINNIMKPWNAVYVDKRGQYQWMDCDFSINKFAGGGGEITGSFNGKVELTPVDSLTFTNGSFSAQVETY